MHANYITRNTICFHINGSNLLRNAKCLRASVLSLMGTNSASYTSSVFDSEKKAYIKHII